MASSSLGSRARRAALGVLIPMMVGCAVVPRNKLEETQGANRELRASLAEAKDSIARLQTQNRDLAARSIEESRRNVALEEANERFERDIMAYQEEREQYAAALDQIKGQVLASSGRLRPSASLGPIERFVADHPGATFDAQSCRLTLPTKGFFRPGTDELLPGPAADLDRLIQSLAPSDRTQWSVRLTGADLGRAKSERVRDVLAKAGNTAVVVTLADADASLVRVVAK